MPFDLDPDRTLALSYVPVRSRASVGALWRLDSALGAALAGGREPMIARIKLAWWREALERLDREPAPAEPVLQEAAAALLPAISGAELARMEEGFDDLDAPVLRVTDEDVPLPYAANLERMALIQVDKVVETARKVCYR